MLCSWNYSDEGNTWMEDDKHSEVSVGLEENAGLDDDAVTEFRAVPEDNTVSSKTRRWRRFIR